MKRRRTSMLAAPWLAALLLGIGAGAQAEVYRFQPMFLSEVSLALGLEPKLDESNTLKFGVDEAAQRFPAAARIGFDTFGDASLKFPNEVAAVIGVKPARGVLRDTLLVPLEHVGSGSYRIPQKPEVLGGLAGWIAAHRDQIGSGQVVLERVDGLYRQLRELNPDATVGVSMHLSVAGQRLDSGLQPSYERLPREFMDRFPAEFWDDVRKSGHPALRRELMLRDFERAAAAFADAQ